MSIYNREVLFSRMYGIISPDELEILKEKTVAIPGCGGVGFTHAEMLVRSGIGNIHIADLDTFGPENMNRQFGATIDTIGARKVDVLAERLKKINPDVIITKFSAVGEDSVDEFINGVDIICDAMDYFIMTPRLVLHRSARTAGISVMNAGPIGFGAVFHLTDPKGMRFEDYFGIDDNMSNDDLLAQFGIGLDPSKLHRKYQDEAYLDFKNKAVSSISSSCLLSSSLIGAAAIPFLLDRQSNFKPIPYSYQLDLQAGQFIESLIPGGVNEIKQWNPDIQTETLEAT